MLLRPRPRRLRPACPATLGPALPPGPAASGLYDPSAYFVVGETNMSQTANAWNSEPVGATPAGGSATFGLLGNGTAPASLSNLTCTASGP